MVTVGVDGMGLGDDTPLPGELVHPFIVWETLYVFASVTVMDEVVAPVFQSNVPIKPPAIRLSCHSYSRL